MSDSDRFAFGKNWSAFLATIDQQRIEQAEQSLREMLGGVSLAGKRFLDIGSGSGLFSLAAHRMGAQVVSLDYDQDSVQCTEYLRQEHQTGSASWQVHQGSVLDEPFMESLGKFDVVYSWGVLHHTGDMNRAIQLASDRTDTSGTFAISIYNDQGGGSRRWLWIKQTYNRLPRILQPVWVGLIAGIYETKFALARLAKLQNPLPFADWDQKRHDRGMSVWHDWVDWVGGLPFEVAKPESIIVPLRKRGFTLEHLTTVGSGWGCNEYVFSRD